MSLSWSVRRIIPNHLLRLSLLPLFLLISTPVPLSYNLPPFGFTVSSPSVSPCSLGPGGRDTSTPTYVGLGSGHTGSPDVLGRTEKGDTNGPTEGPEPHTSPTPTHTGPRRRDTRAGDTVVPSEESDTDGTTEGEGSRAPGDGSTPTTRVGMR